MSLPHPITFADLGAEAQPRIRKVDPSEFHSVGGNGVVIACGEACLPLAVR